MATLVIATVGVAVDNYRQRSISNALREDRARVAEQFKKALEDLLTETVKELRAKSPASDGASSS